MASLDYFDPNEEQTPPVPAGGEAAAPAGPVSLANPQAGTAGGAPDRPSATPLGSPSGIPAQNGTGFVSIDRYFAPNSDVSARQTSAFLGGLSPDKTETVSGPAPTPQSFEEWAKEHPVDLGGAKGEDKIAPLIQRDQYNKYIGGLKPETIEVTTPGTLGQAQDPGGVIGALQKDGGPNYSAGMGGLDAYLMGRSGLEGGMRGLQDYFNPDPVSPTPSQGQSPRKYGYDEEMDRKRRVDSAGGRLFGGGYGRGY